MDMKHKSRKAAVVLTGCIFAAAALLMFVFGLIEQLISEAENIPAAGLSSAEDSSDGTLYYKNAWYVPEESLETLLVLGIDKRLDGSEDRAESEQVDFLALLVIDIERERFRILHLNRDTMTDIPMPDAAGIVMGTFRGQLALAHAYGSHDDSRCRNTVRAVENLLFGTEIDHYLSLTMDAVAILNDSIGGVAVTLPVDMESLGKAGDVVTLTGDQALYYVRERSGLEDSSNLQRMERQQQYISALFAAFSETAENNTENTFETLLHINEYMVSDYTAEQLSSLIEKLGGYTYDGILTLAGEAVQRNEYMEFRIDEAAARQTVVDLFYHPADSR